MPNRNIAIRLSVMEGGKVKAELKEIGATGDKSLKKIESAGKRSSKGLLALSAAANDMRGAATGLSTQIGPLGSGLSALGPAGLTKWACLIDAVIRQEVVIISYILTILINACFISVSHKNGSARYGNIGKIGHNAHEEC